MTAISHDVLRRLPKAELHCHLDGSVRPSTLLELGHEFGVPMPATTADALAHHMYVRDARHLEDYLTRFDTTLSVMQGEHALERIAFELAEDAASEGVRYIEVRYAPILNQQWGLSLDAVIEAPLRGLERAREKYGITGRVIVCGLRHLSPDISLELAKLAVAFQDKGVVGFDLAGGESGHPASAHRAAFHHAREPFINHRFKEHHGGRRTVARAVIRLIRDLLHNFRTHIFKLVFEGHLFRDGDAVIRDARAAVAAINHHVPPSRAERHFHCVCGFRNTRVECLPRVFAE